MNKMKLYISMKKKVNTVAVMVGSVIQNTIEKTCHDCYDIVMHSLSGSKGQWSSVM